MSALPTTVSADDTMVLGGLQVLKADLGAMTWSEATQRSASLGANWRLPSIVELQQLFDRKDEIGGFVDNLYWSSDEVPPANACIQSFVELKTANDDKNYLFFVRPVRSVQTIALQGLEILDTDLGLLHWDEANTACARVGSGWRLPTADELDLLFRNKETIGGFVDSFYWGSTEVAPELPCIQGFINGKQSKDRKTYEFHVRPVRSAQP